MHEMHITAFGDSSMGGTGISEWFSRLKLKEVANWRQMLVKYHFADYWQQGRRERIRAPVKKKKKNSGPPARANRLKIFTLNRQDRL